VRTLLAAALSALMAAPCAAIGEGDEDDAVPGLQPTNGFVLFYDDTAPMSFVAMTPRDVPEGALKIREVRGVSCQRGLSIPLAASLTSTSVSGNMGDGGYAKAIAQIRKAHPEVSGIYDVRADLQDFSLFGLYRSLCTIVTARAFVAVKAP
jgi:hypothetical protein